MAGNVKSFKDLGNESFKLRNYTKAKEYYTKAIEANESLDLIYSNRAQCNLNLGLYYDALDDCNSAISLKPDLTKAYYRRARALKELSRFESALKDYQQVLEIEPDNRSAKHEVESIKLTLVEDKRIDLRTYKKPDRHCSKTEVKLFELQPSKHKSSLVYTQDGN